MGERFISLIPNPDNPLRFIIGTENDDGSGFVQHPAPRPWIDGPLRDYGDPGAGFRQLAAEAHRNGMRIRVRPFSF